MNRAEFVATAVRARASVATLIDHHKICLDDARQGIFDRDGVVQLYASLLEGTLALQKVLNEQLDWMTSMKKEDDDE